jgi:RNA polymerase sigma factor (sigma-70 family)
MAVIDRPKSPSRKTVKPRVEDHVRLVFHIVQKLVPPSVKPEDCDEFSDGMIGLWKATNGYDNVVGEFSSYAYECIRNQIRTGRQIRRKQTMNMVDEKELYHIPDEENNLSALEHLQKLLEQKHENPTDSTCIKIIRDHYIVGIPLTELSIKYKLNRTTVYRYLEKGLSLLKDKLSQFSEDAALHR